MALNKAIVTVAATLALASSLLAQDDRPKKYALIIGLNEVDKVEKVPSLKYAKEDANELKKLLDKHQFDKTIQLIDENALRDVIINHLSRLAIIVKEQDTFLLYFAGHGVRSRSGRGTYWLTWDTDTDRLDVNGIRLSHLLDYVADIPAKRKIVVLDHCYSGDVDLKVTPGVVGSTDERISAEFVPGVAARPSIPTDVIDRAVANRGSETLVIAAARGFAYELPNATDISKGHGVLTTALLKAYESRAADTTKDGKLSAGELVDYLSREISRLSALAGQLQQMHATATTIGLNSWILTESLPLDPPANQQEARALAAVYLGLLNAWQIRGEITSQEVSDAANMFDIWTASFGGGRTLTPQETAAIESFRLTLERGVNASATDVKTSIKNFLGRATS